MNAFSKAFKDLPQNLQHIVPLDLNSTRTVPDSHIWFNSDEFESKENGQSLPIVDLKEAEAATLIRQGCETWDLVQVKSHGVPLDLLEEVEWEVKRLFDLPFARKLKALRSAGSASGYGRARISPFFDKYMWHKGFTIIGSPVGHVKLLWSSEYQR